MKKNITVAATLLLSLFCGISSSAQDENLKIKFLGTGAADWLKPREDGEWRRNASILVDDAVLVDLAWSAIDMIPQEAHPEVIFYTHSHSDHFQPEIALNIGVKKVYLGATWADRGRRDFEAACKKTGRPMPEIIPLTLSQTVMEHGIAFTALPANHGTQNGNEQALIYLLEKNGTRVLYATDTGGLMADAVQPIGIDIHNWTPNPIHGLIMESTVGWDEEDYRLFCHSNIPTVIRTHNVLVKTKRYLPAPGQPVYLTHIGEECHGSQAELDATLPPFLKAPVDGETVIFNHDHLKKQKYGPSFTYGGKAFDAQEWFSNIDDRGEGQTRISYLSPDKKLRLCVNYKRYKDFPVVRISPVIECAGDTPTDIIENFKSLDFSSPCPSGSALVRRITGSESKYTDFSHKDVLLQDKPECTSCSMSSVLGRSAEWIPYFGVDFNSMEGLECAIGWTGTWKADFSVGKEFSMGIGLGHGTHFRLLPGESFKLPYILIYERNGKSTEQGLVDFHRFLVDHNSPRDKDGKLWETFLPLTSGGGNKTDDRILTIIEKGTSLFKVPFNVFWVDAGWYGPYHEVDQDSNCGPCWYNYVGNWNVNRYSHPDGNLKKISDAAHAHGMKFLLWFEPERATAQAPIVAEHPEYFNRVKENPSENQYLLDLGNKEARDWALSEVCRNIEESGVDIYRQDFNFNPARIWYDNDAPDRMGIHEISHINGLYEFWDTLHCRFPELMFESCSGGGTRVDIEMMSRAHSYCRDDAQMFPDCEELCQNITINATPYIPFTGGETFTVKPFDTYAWMSCIAAGTVFTPSDFQGMLLKREPSRKERAWLGSMLTAASRVRPYFCGDFYNLTKGSLAASDCICGYQCNKDSDGFFMVFRRKDCQEETFLPGLRAIDPTARYLLEEYGGKTVKIKGSELSELVLTLESPRSCALYFYKKLN